MCNSWIIAASDVNDNDVKGPKCGKPCKDTIKHTDCPEGKHCNNNYGPCGLTCMPKQGI